MFLNFLWSDPMYYFSWVVIVCFSISVHECSHAFTAYTRGDSTAYDRGYLTLNPLKVMGLYSFIALGVLGLAWASVPVNKSRLRRASDSALISFSGPATNLGLALVFALVAAVSIKITGEDAGGMEQAFAVFFKVGVSANAFLALLNILPVPFLDGWDVFTYFVPEARRLSEQTQGYITLGVILGLIFLDGFPMLFMLSGKFAGVTIGFFKAILGG